MQDKLIEYEHYIGEHGEDMPEVRNWKWSQGEPEKVKPLPEKPRGLEPSCENKLT